MDGSGAPFVPITSVVPRALFPLYNKPIVYYPLSVLLLAGIREILLISTPEDAPGLQQLLGDGSQWGIHLSYAIRSSPDGAGEAFVLGSEFIGAHSVALVLGNMIFDTLLLEERLKKATVLEKGACGFVYSSQGRETHEKVMEDPVLEALASDGRSQSIDSRYLAAGLYCYDHSVVEKARELASSTRSPWHIADLNRIYFAEGRLGLEILDRDIFWSDLCSIDAVLKAANWVYAMESQQSQLVGSPEEICWRKGYIDDAQLEKLGTAMGEASYGQFLLRILGTLK